MKPKPANTNLMYKKKMEKIKAVIERYCKGKLLQEPLPSVKELAGSVSLSEATLKRQFRLCFDISVYDYYLQRKMQLAGQKIIDNPKISVNKLARDLGYEKTSNLITIFKRFYEMTPGAIEPSHIRPILKKLS